MRQPFKPGTRSIRQRVRVCGIRSPAAARGQRPRHIRTRQPWGASRSSAGAGMRPEAGQRVCVTCALAHPGAA